MKKLRLKFLVWLIWFYWWCERAFETVPHPSKTKRVFFEPISGTAIIASILISAATSLASYAISSLLAPKPKPVVKGKLTGDITLTDSIFGADKIRIYGARPGGTDNAGGVEVGGNIFWASEIRKIQTQVPGTGGSRGGKGRSQNTPPTIQINYKIDLAAGIGPGPLRLLRLKLNEDVVYDLLGNGGGQTGNPGVSYEAEDPGNTLDGGAAIAADPGCSGGQKVTGIGSGGSLTFNDIPLGAELEPEPGAPLPRNQIEIRYKSTGDCSCYVYFTNAGGTVGSLYSFPDTGGVVGRKYITRVFAEDDYDIEFSNPDAAGPEIDRIIVRTIVLYGYSVTGVLDTAFPPESPQDNILLPDPKLEDTNALERYNALVEENPDGTIFTTLANGANLAWYPGTEDQPIDAVIAAQVDAQYGANSTPAFRGTAYCRLQDLDFTKYGSVPNLRFVVENMTTQTVEEICLAEAALVGLDEMDFDLSAAADKHVRGFYLQGNEAPVKAFEEMALVHNLSFVETGDGKIVAKDLFDRTVKASINSSDLGAYIVEESEEPPLDDVVMTLPDESELIREFELQFHNPLAPSDFNTDRKKHIFPHTASRRVETKQTSSTLLAEEALEIVQRELQKHHLKAVPYNFSLPHKYAWLEPGDCLEIEIDGEMKPVRLEEKNGSAPGIYECSATDEDVFELVGETFLSTDEAKITKQAVTVPANTVGTLIDVEALEDADNKPGFYAAATPKYFIKDTTSWAGAALYRYKGGDWQRMATFKTPALMGRTVDALPDLPPGYADGAWDDTSSVTIDFFGVSSPTSVTESDAEDGANSFVIGNEVVVVETWTRDNDYPNRWTANGFIRLAKNSDPGVAGTHQAGERAVYLSDAVRFIPVDETEVSKERTWKFVTFGQRIEDAAPVEFNWSGNSVTPEAFIATEEFTLTAGVDTVSLGHEPQEIIGVELQGQGLPAAYFSAAGNVLTLNFSTQTGNRLKVVYSYLA